MVWILLLACRPDDRAFAGMGASLDVSPPEVDIGPAPVGGTASAELYVWNETGDGVLLDAEVFGEGFEVVGGPWALVGDAQLTITILFAPEALDDATGTLVLHGGRADVGVALSGDVATDWDGDSYDAELAGGDDCDDRDPGVNPGAVEIWYDGVDQDCDTNDADQDGDGIDAAADCDDVDASRYPGATELVDGIDQDCDGIVDENLAPGALVITELLVAPAAAPAIYGQYLEVYNRTAQTVGIGGWTLTSGAARGSVSPSVVIAPFGLAVLCPSADPAFNGALPCDGVVQPWPLFEPTEDCATLVAEAPDDASNEQDAVAWNASWSFPSGVSLTLGPDALDPLLNDDRSHWCEAAVAWAKGDLGSPGLANVPCP